MADLQEMFFFWVSKAEEYSKLAGTAGGSTSFLALLKFKVLKVWLIISGDFNHHYQRQSISSLI